MRTLRMAAKNLVARPSRTVLTMFGIILGVSVIIAVSITNESTVGSLNAVFGEVAGNSDLMVMSSTDDEEGFPEEARRRVISVPGVKAAAASVHALAVLAGDTTERDLEIGLMGAAEQRLMLYGIDPQIDPDVRVYKLVAGHWLANDLDLYEVVLVEDFARDEEIELGDDLPILTPNGIELVRVVGLISKEGAGQANNGMFGAMPIRAVQEIFNRAGEVDQIDIVVSGEKRTKQGLETLRVEIGDKLGDRYSVTVISIGWVLTAFGEARRGLARMVLLIVGMVKRSWSIAVVSSAKCPSPDILTPIILGILGKASRVGPYTIFAL